MTRPRHPCAETVAHARSMQAMTDQPDALIGKQLARRLWAALKAREGDILRDFLSHEALEIVDPAYRAAAILFTRGIFIEPCRRLLSTQAVVYLATWPDGTTRNLAEADLLTLAGITV